MAAICRSAEQVDITAKAAGLNSRTGPTQVLKFSDKLTSEDYKLLELPDEVLNSFKNGERVVIRGETQDDAVLCTENATYDLKMADTSNTVMLTSNLLLPKTEEFKVAKGLKETVICGSLYSYYELRHCRPKLQRLNILLRESAYKGEDYEKRMERDENGLEKYSFDDLLGKVQASENELRLELRNLEALEIEGYWRVLETDYREKVVVHILNLLEENSWSYEHVPFKETCDVLQELEPRFIISHCLKCYGTKISMDTEDLEQTEQTTETYYRLSEDRICRFYAEYLLRPAGMFNYHEFMESWKQSVPEGMIADESHLKGLALSNMESQPPVIWHFPKENLPQEPAQRFNKLFKTRAKWKLEEIQPYLANLESPGQSLKALLLKFARCSTDAQGNKVYNSKRPIS